MEKGKFTNFKNSYKININSYDNKFFRRGDQGKKKIISAEKNLGG